VGAAGAESGDFTVTMGDAREGSDSGVDALSVTRSLKPYVSPAVSFPPTIVQVSVSPALAPVPLLVVHNAVGAYAAPFTETRQSQA